MKVFFCLFFLIGLKIYAQQATLVPFEENKKWGYKDIHGNVIVAPQYQYVTKFHKGYASVYNDYKVGSIDSLGNLIIPVKYEYLEYIDNNHFVFGYRTKYFGEYDVGIIDSNEKVLIKPVFYYIQSVNDVYEVTLNKDSIMYSAGGQDVRSVKSFHGIYNQEGKEVLPPIYDYIRWVDDKLIVLSKDNSEALYTKNGENVTEFEYLFIGKFNNSLAAVKKEGKCGYLSKEGILRTPVIYDRCTEFMNNKAIINVNGKWGLIDSNGNAILQPQYEYEYIIENIKNE